MFRPCDRYVSVKGFRPEKLEPFTREEMREVFLQFWRNKPETIRNKALIAFLYRCAARIGATLRMLPSDIDWNRSLVRVYKDKGGKSRTVIIDEKAKKFLWRWHEIRQSLGIGNDKPFFCTTKRTHRGFHVSEPNILIMFRTMCRRAGITRRVTLHLLRHTGASELLEEGFDVASISRVLGHSSILTTYRYLHELRPDLMNSKLAVREW